MGEYQICNFCGNLSEKTKYKMCPHCEEIYFKIRSFVEKNPDTIILEIASKTGVSVSRIMSFVNNGFFILREGTLELK